MNSRVDLLLEVGVDIDTAISIDDEVSRLSERTQRVFDMRVKGYTQQEIAEGHSHSEGTTRYHLKKCKSLLNDLRFSEKSVPYRDRG